jgi:hypothetical protein
MTYYHQASQRGHTPPRVHPLLLSLAEVYNKSPLNISSISRDDPRILSSKYYTSPDDLPPLDIHFPGQNGAALLCNTHGSPLTSAASCGECLASEPQGNSAEVGDVGMNTPLAASSPEPMTLEPQENLAEVGNATMTMPSAAASSPEPMASEPQDNSAEVANASIAIPKGKKRRHASSGVVRTGSKSHIFFIEMLH